MLLALLGFAAVTQVKANEQDDQYVGARQGDLIQYINNLSLASQRAESEIARLQRTRDALRSDTRAAPYGAGRAPSSRPTTLGILAGTVPVVGPGVRVTVTDEKGGVGSNQLLEGLEELRDAGAEAIELNDKVRVVAQTSLKDAGEGVLVDGQLLKPPYVIEAIGNAHDAGHRAGLQGRASSTRCSGPASTARSTMSRSTPRRRRGSPRSWSPRHRGTPSPADDADSLPRHQRPAIGLTTDRPRRSAVYPEDLKYTSEHEWVRSPGEAEGSVRVGITDYAQDALGDIVYVSLPRSAPSVAERPAVGELESTKSVSDVYAPLGGEVVARNEALDATPELVNSDPYGEGWLFEIVPADAAAVDGLMDAATYQSSLES